MTERFPAFNAPMQFLPAPNYQPGVCNIGAAEIRRRRMAAGHRLSCPSGRMRR